MHEKLSIHNSEPVISIHGLFKSFGDLHVLRGIDLDVFKGENVVVLGRSGTGKSVLIKIIAGLLAPDAGSVSVLEKQVAELNEKDLRGLRRRLGFLFQSSALYDSMSVRENLEFPLLRNVKNLTRNQIDEAVEAALEAVGLPDKISQMPADLSGGQRKRIGIARTLMLKPEIMLYDEPTAGLDPITSIEINGLINDVQEKYGASSLIITHDLACAKQVGNRILMLLDGKFTRQGTFDEVFLKAKGKGEKAKNAAPDDGDDLQIEQFFKYNFTQ